MLWTRRSLRHLGGPCRDCLGLIFWQRELGDDRLGTSNDTLLQVAGSKRGQDLGLDDRRRQCVRQHRFEPVTDLDPHLSVVGGHDQDNPIIANLVAYAPSTTKLIAVILDWVALQIRDRRYHHLVTRLLLEICQLGGKFLLYLRRKQVRLVNDPSRQGWELGRGDRRAYNRKKGQNRNGDHAARSCNPGH